MPVLFVSHSSKDDIAVQGLEAWLRGHGFNDLFVDHSAIQGGDKWAQKLREASGACRAVMCLVTRNWLVSDECFGEFKAAWYMGKRIIPLLALAPGAEPHGDRLAKVLAEDQGLDVLACMNDKGELDLNRDVQIERRLVAGLREAGALSDVGLDPEAFSIDRKLRPTPFPGLSSFGDEDADAALFYGRSREIAEIIEELRQARAVRELRPLVILGASGAGKSSLLKAGIIPRLRREIPAWLPLRAFRPGADPLFNFSDALARTLADFGKDEPSGAIRERLFDAWATAGREDNELTEAGRGQLDAALKVEGRKLRAAADRAGATILISVDQAEEIARSESDSGEALAGYLRAAATSADQWQLVFTIRTDSFPELQNNRRFRDLNAHGYDLRGLPKFRFDSVVEAPAKRYGVTVTHELVDGLMMDAPSEDALPLLAFALERLWNQHAASKALTKSNYEKVGGLKGLIEDAAERALRGILPGVDVGLPAGPPPRNRIDLAASTFVPTLVQVNEQGAMIRQIAEWSKLSSEQQELLQYFEKWRLVVRKGGLDGGTVEVAHEALFREWARLKGWLEPERARLEALRSLQVDALTWDRNGRSLAFLNHRYQRLAEAKALSSIEAYRKRVTPLEFEYVAACERAERSARARARNLRAVVYLLLVGIIGGLLGWINQATIFEEWRWYATERPFRAANMKPYVLATAAERGLKPDSEKTFRECAPAQPGKDFCPDMLVVPAGSFIMGSPPSEPGHPDESPPHKVTIGKPFAVSKFEVTFEQWDTCAAYGDCRPDVPAAEFGRGRRPVINVSWDDATQYVAWLSKMTGKTYRLLSEAEYEYAARGGNQTAYPWGPESKLNGKPMANCAGCGSQWDTKKTAPVGSFSPNGFGLFDMVGNVWEWVQDCYHPNYDGAPTDGSSWTSGDCGRRVDRGGGFWHDTPEFIRAAARDKATPDRRGFDLGFRIARTLGP